MAENSKIEWTDHTFNPWMGCTKVSDGCKNCYAETLMDHRYGKVQWGPQGTRLRTSPQNWRKPIKWNEEAAMLGIRYKVFCASLADVFEEKDDQPELEEWRADLFDLIEQTPYLDWLLLTKRPENVNAMLPREWRPEAGWDHPIPANVWIGTSVENQEQADKRIPELLRIPAAKRFLSIEPLLSAVDLSPVLSVDSDFAGWVAENRSTLLFPADLLDWVIVGGESGTNARPMHPDWVRSLRDQCVDAGVPFFFKQWGKWAPDCLCDTKKAHDTIQRPGESLSVMFSCGKKNAGRLLDGREWNEVPQ